MPLPWKGNTHSKCVIHNHNNPFYESVVHLAFVVSLTCRAHNKLRGIKFYIYIFVHSKESIHTVQGYNKAYLRNSFFHYYVNFSRQHNLNAFSFCMEHCVLCCAL